MFEEGARGSEVSEGTSEVPEGGSEGVGRGWEVSAGGSEGLRGCSEVPPERVSHELCQLNKSLN